MSSTFTLTITLGNDAMCCDEDVVYALRRASASIIQTGKKEGSVMDENGNKVGEWAFPASDEWMYSEEA